jgi:hypothetical protein
MIKDELTLQIAAGFGCSTLPSRLSVFKLFLFFEQLLVLLPKLVALGHCGS